MRDIPPDRQLGNWRASEAARATIMKTQTICGICGKPVDFSLKYPHPLSATVDHIVPVSKGGHPSDISNLQLAHRCCNRAKSDKLLETFLSEKGRRANANEFSPDMFTNQEYSDIMANYTLLWIDETFIDEYRELGKLIKKEKNYTLKEIRKKYDIQLDIIKRI